MAWNTHTCANSEESNTVNFDWNYDRCLRNARAQHSVVLIIYNKIGDKCVTLRALRSPVACVNFFCAHRLHLFCISRRSTAQLFIECHFQQFVLYMIAIFSLFLYPSRLKSTRGRDKNEIIHLKPTCYSHQTHAWHNRTWMQITISTATQKKRLCSIFFPSLCLN